ncbi:hypothetical protein [Leeuwenhoekiella nanhaiensis]|uniref:Uncharacterized protein n=1 Tax=Leeuwenhoekiella nanhaiensis TaxID=1655491 RepID=A0A2G1VPL4_9FLAO|nr:hypothetical protein [Leeuwenhoekiella nanhaiensis]PHQ28706.1 hypothetical protein CJ305_12870 [Leeuwenhoekiella nanhaiensis]
MGFGGSVSAMLATLKTNKRERKSRFDKKGLDIKTAKHKPFIDFKKLAASEELKLKNQIRKDSRNHNRKVIGYTAIALVVLAVLIWLLFVDSGRPLV